MINFNLRLYDFDDPETNVRLIYLKVNGKEHDIGSLTYQAYTDSFFLCFHLYGQHFYPEERDPRSWKSLQFSKTYEGNAKLETITQDISDFVDFFCSH